MDICIRGWIYKTHTPTMPLYYTGILTVYVALSQDDLKALTNIQCATSVHLSSGLLRLTIHHKLSDAKM